MLHCRLLLFCWVLLCFLLEQCWFRFGHCIAWGRKGNVCYCLLNIYHVTSQTTGANLKPRSRLLKEGVLWLSFLSNMASQVSMSLRVTFLCVLQDVRHMFAFGATVT